MTGRSKQPRADDGGFWERQAATDWALPFELIDGDPVVVDELDAVGLSVRRQVRSLLRRWQEQVGDDGLVATATQVALCEGTWMLADLAYWSRDPPPQELGAAGRPPPDLMVFVQRAGSPGRYEERRRDVAGASGVADVWTLTPQTAEVTTLRQGVRKHTDMVMSPSLRGFSMAASLPFLTAR